MPKKTKKEKLAAETHRKMALPPVSLRGEKPKELDPVTPSQSFQFRFASQTTKKEQKHVGDVAMLSLIKKDLTKTVILAAIAIATELFLYSRSIVR